MSEQTIQSCIFVLIHFHNFRELLANYVWTNTNKSKGACKKKFSELKYVLDLFYETVLHSDTTYSIANQTEFFQNKALKHAVQRLNSKGSRRNIQQESSWHENKENAKANHQTPPDPAANSKQNVKPVAKKVIFVSEDTQIQMSNEGIKNSVKNAAIQKNNTMPNRDTRISKETGNQPKSIETKMDATADDQLENLLGTSIVAGQIKGNNVRAKTILLIIKKYAFLYQIIL